MPDAARTREVVRRALAAYRARKRASGVCVACGCWERAVEGYMHCSHHLRENVAKGRSKREAKHHAAETDVDRECGLHRDPEIGRTAGE